MGEIDFTTKSALVVDDMANMRQTLREMLRTAGVRQIDDVATGERAIDALAQGDYDIVLCDYNLGRGKDGQQVLEEVRHRRLIRLSTVFIMVTAESMHHRVMGAVEHQPDDYLTKPFTPALLAKRLERHMLRRDGLRPVDQAVSLGAYEKAVELCDQRLANRAGNPDELMRLKLDFHLQLKQYDAAARVCHDALERHRVPWALCGLGRVAAARGESAQAEAAFEQAIAEFPSYMEAYDGLAEVLTARGDTELAQAVVAQALEISPNSVIRQRRLGALACANDDPLTAEAAYKRAAALGKGSVFRSHTDYAELAKAQVQLGAPEDAIEQTLGAMRKETRGKGEAVVDAALSESTIYRQLNREERAAAAFQRAGDVYQDLGGAVAPHIALELGQQALAQGDTELGMRAIQGVVRNHHDDEQILLRAQAIFADSGMASEGDQAIRAITEEVRKKNNHGVALARRGALKEAVMLFEEVLAELRHNTTVNLNAAQVYLMMAKKGGHNEQAGAQLLEQAGACLERVRQQDPHNAKLLSLTGVLQHLERSAVQERSGSTPPA
ncbi:response regulator [Halorhodospira abdelmalekii]|uniref:response regulator n=1 Tax=Halorhodospira abdelmalekii TaxID=421629 RepID=UPI001908208F|nr:response regulator [Halorhodospira abdelmalekii]